jgi:hypothetical protein
LIICVLILALIPVTISAGTTVVVTNIPSYGIMNFTYTEINEHQIQYDWDFGSNVINIMIRAQYGESPDEIPNEDTAPSDGYLIYYGNDVTATDYSVMLDGTSTIPLYVKVWAQKADGHWITNKIIVQTILEGLGMTLGVIIILVLVLTLFSFSRKNLLITFGAAVMWMFLWWYTRQNPINGVTIGSFGDQIIYYLCWIMFIGIFVQYFLRSRKESQLEQRGFAIGDNGFVAGSEKPRFRTRTGLMDMSTDEYRAEMHARLHKNDRR